MNARAGVSACDNPVLGEDLAGWGSLDGMRVNRLAVSGHHTASYAAQVAAAPALAGMYLPELEVRAGEGWAIGVDTRAVAGGTAWLDVDWYDAAGQYLDSTAGPAAALAPGGAHWVRVCHVFTAPAGAARCHPLLRAALARAGAGWWATAASYDRRPGSAALAPATASAGDEGVQAAVLRGWGPVLDGDEFDYTGAPRADRWEPFDGRGHDGNGRRTPAALSVANGILTNHGDANGNTGGMAFRSGHGSRTYRWEARMRLYPVGRSSGSPYHPVLIGWPDSEEWPEGGEDDWVETDIGSGRVEAFIHWPGTDPSAQSAASVSLDITAWHNYAVERSASAVAGFVDGVEWFRFTDPAVLRIPGPMHPSVQLDCFDPRARMQPANQELGWFRIYAAPA